METDTANSGIKQFFVRKLSYVTVEVASANYEHLTTGVTTAIDI